MKKNKEAPAAESKSNDSLKRGPLRNFTAGRVVQAVVMSLCISLMLAIFTPLDIVLNNQRDFVLDYSYFLKAMIMPAALIFSGVLAAAVIALMINETLFKFVSMLTLGLTAAFYAQELFFNGKMTEASNGTFLNAIPSQTLALNFVIFIEIILIPPALVLFNAYNKKKNETAEKSSGKETGVLAKNIVTVIFAGITLMQLTGYVSSYTRNDPKKYRSPDNGEDTMVMFKYDGLTSFSKENNVVVFLLDRLDGFWTDDILEASPGLKQELDGFTYYRNNMSHYTHTFPSVPSMLTHNVYDNSEWADYLAKVWQGENALSELKDNGYEVELILSNTTTYNLPESVMPYCDNMETLSAVKRTIKNDSIRKTLMTLTASRILPYALKDMFYFAVDNVVNQKFYEYEFDADNANYAPLGTSCEGDIMFYDFTKSAVFDADSAKKKFSFIHLCGAHDNNPELIEKTGVKLNIDSRKATAAANLETVKMYLENAKKLGVYDNTTFIIMSDHGINPEEITDARTGELKAPDVSTLMVKPAGAEHGELKIDSVSTLSNDMFSASILEYAGLDHSAYGDSYNDIVTSGKSVTRPFVTFKWLNSTVSDPVEEFEITGDARDFSNWKKIK